MEFLLVEALSLQSFQTLENSHQGGNIGITSSTCMVWRITQWAIPYVQYHPYLVSFLFIPSLYPSFLIRRIFLFSSLLSFFCMYAYIKSSGFIGGKGPRSLKKLSFCQIKGEVQSGLLHNYLSEAGCFLLKALKCITLSTWGWLLLVTSMLCCHENGNVGLHVCVKFHDHTYTVLYAHRIV